MADSKISALSDGTSPQSADQFVIARSTSDLKLTWSELLTLMPGYEVARAQITSNANVTDTLESTATALITVTATFPGVPVYAEFYAEGVSTGTASTPFVVITLFEGSTEITRLGAVQSPSSAVTTAPMCARYKFTPSAASHTYKVCGFVNSATGTPAIIAGAGGTATPAPAYLRFVIA